MVAIGRTSIMAILAAMALGVGLSGCGGGGGGVDTPASTVSASGTAAMGIFTNADVKAYDATVGETGTPLATGVTNSQGQYSLTLPAGFSKPIIVVISAKADGSSKTKDEIFGEIAMSAGFTLRSVIPATTGSTITGHVTPFTNLMYEIVKNKIGRSDIDAAIKQAKSAVSQLSGNMDPLSTNPATEPAMVVQLAAVSNMATSDLCKNEGSIEKRITCTVAKIATAITPMAAEAITSGDVTLAKDQAILTTLTSAIKSLNPLIVAQNTGLTSDQLKNSQTAISSIYDEFDNTLAVTIPNTAVLSGIDQAKAFFKNLRAGILPYSNDAEEGFLDTQAEKLNSELNTLSLASVNGLDTIVNVTRCAFGMIDATPITNISCYVDGILVQLAHRSDLKTITWTGGNQGVFNGSFVYTGTWPNITSLKANGYIPRMSAGATIAKVGKPAGDDDSNASEFSITKTSPNGIDRYSFAGTIKDLRCVSNACTPVLKLELDPSATYLDFASPTSELPEIFKFKGTFISKNYRFIGEISASSIQWNQNGDDALGGVMAFIGTINGVGLDGLDNDSDNNFNILVGKLEGKVDAQPQGTSWTFDPSKPNADNNYQKSSLTFTGTTFKTASDPGLKLVLTFNEDWDPAKDDYLDKLRVDFNDYNKGITLTGQTSYLDHSTDHRTITLSDNNGIKVQWIENTSTKIMQNDTVLGTINNNRITYSDGSFESLQ